MPSPNEEWEDEAWIKDLRATEDVNWAPLTNRFFHALGEDGYVRWQGRFLTEPSDQGFVVVQLFDWVVGSSGGVRMVGLSELVERGLYLYQNDGQMREAYQYGFVPRRPRPADDPAEDI